MVNSPEQKTAVVVTGGASGIGKASAEALACAGRPVAIWDLDREKSEAVARQLEADYSVPALGLGIDVASLDIINGAVAETRKGIGAIGGLVHAAGVDGVGPIEALNQETWSRTIDINLRAFAFIIQALLPDLRANAGSAIVGIASINATLGNKINPSYSASKGGMLAMSRALADELGADNIRINCVSPGQIDTPLLQRSMEATPGLREAFERRILLGRLADPIEVGRVVRFLLSTEASYVTASEIVVDGGNISSQR